MVPELVSEVAPVTPMEGVDVPMLLIEIADALLTVRLESAVDPPITPASVTVPPLPPVNEKSCAPLIVVVLPEKLMAAPRWGDRAIRRVDRHCGSQCHGTAHYDCAAVRRNTSVERIEPTGPGVVVVVA